MELVIRFDYGSIVPWVRTRDGGLTRGRRPRRGRHLHADVELHGEDFRTVGRVHRRDGRAVPFVLTWLPSHLAAPAPIDADARARGDAEPGGASGPAAAATRATGATRCVRSLITLKALTYAPTGGIVAAPDDLAARAARRRAQLGLPLLLAARRDVHALALSIGGYTDEARAWRDWLLRAVGRRSRRSCRSCTASAGERRLPELELPWLPGYEDRRRCASATPRVEQLQLDVYGEVHGRAARARATAASTPRRRRLGAAA